ncbi:hypothetical protein IMZ48_23675 [Candidatus Bathyarchaeota archaeon]|nr:hypothetical protein [Candidatus Bathyarchaeota archaeon]
MESEKESERSGEDIRGATEVEKAGATEVEKAEGNDLPDNNPQTLSKKLANPLAGFTPEQLSNQGETFCAQHGITDDKDVRAFRLGAQLAGAEDWRTVEGMTDEERAVLEKEEKSKWTNPKKLYLVVLSTLSRCPWWEMSYVLTAR